MRTIKFLMLASIFCVFVTKSFAQPTIKLGATYSDLGFKDSPVFDVNPKSNLYLGLHYQLFFTDIIGIEPGINYHRLSTNLNSSSSGFKLQRNYVGIPVLIKILPNSVFSFGGGLEASFLAKDNLKDNFENKNFNVSGQLQVTFNPLKQLGFELGYNFGFTPYVTFEDKEFGNFQFRNGEARNEYFYAALLINLR